MFADLLEEHAVSIVRVEDGARFVLQNVGKRVPNYTVSYPRR
jgi:hypothetical protein